MYYSNDNYEVFACPRKPKDEEIRIVCFVGSGLAAKSGATFLIHDGQILGEKWKVTFNAGGNRTTFREFLAADGLEFGRVGPTCNGPVGSAAE